MFQDISANKAKVADLPLKLNLQLFGEDEPEAPVDPVEPAVPMDEAPAEPEETQQPEVVDPEPEKPVQDADTNAKFAQLRREKEAAEKRAKQVDQWVEQNFSHLGLKTWDDYQEYQREEAKRQQYEERGLDYDEVKKTIREELEQHPDVVKAREQKIVAGLNEELAELNREFPDLKIGPVASYNDIPILEEQLRQLPNWEKIDALYKRGYTLADAYEKANREEIRRKHQEATRQATLNNAKGKDHMRANGGEGADIDAIVVPDDVMAMYRQMFRKQLKAGTMKESDFVKHYKQSLKGAK